MFFNSSIDINVVFEPEAPDFKYFLCIPKSSADAAAVNPTHLK